MKDETYVFIQDVKQKGSTARSARNRRTHTGKGGRVKFPSDYMTEKEKKAMNGEVKSYRLNEPMSWDEFKAMPDDIKIVYIKALRQKYGVSDSKIGEMMGAKQVAMSREIRRIGLGVGRSPRKTTAFDKEGWIAWCNGAPVPTTDQPEENTEVIAQPVSEPSERERQTASLEKICDPVPVPNVQILPVREEKKTATPCSGSMTFEGNTESILNTVSALLGGANIRISITWDVLPEDGVCGC